MVNFTKWVLIAAGLIGLGLFTQEAAASGLTGTLQRTGMAGGSIGTGIGQVGAGIGNFFSGTLKPFWEIRNIIRGFMNLGIAEPWKTDTPGGGTNNDTGGGGGIETPTSISQTIISTPADTYSGLGFTYYNEPRLSPIPITNAIVHGQNLPLSAAAVRHYQNLGVTVTPAQGTFQTQTLQQSGGGTTPASGGGGGVAAGNTGALAAAHAAGYSLGSA